MRSAALVVVLLLAPLLVSSSFHDPFVAPKVALVEAAALVCLASLRPARVPPWLAACAALVGLEALSGLWSSAPPLTWAAWPERAALLVLAAAAAATSDERTRGRLVAAATLAGALVASLALLQHAGLDGAAVGWLARAGGPDVRFLVGAESEGWLTSLHATLGNTWITGAHAACLLPAVAGAALGAVREGRPGAGAAWFAAGLVLSTALLLSRARAAWVAAAVGLALFGLAARGLRRSAVLAPLALVAGGLLAAWALGGLPVLGERLAGAFDPSRGSILERRLIARAALTMATEDWRRVLVGGGAGTFGVRYLDAQAAVLAGADGAAYRLRATRAMHAHCEPLQVFAEVGLVGLLLLLAALGLFLRDLAVAARSPTTLPALGLWCSVLVALVHDLAGFATRTPATGALVACLAGLAAASAPREEAAAPPRSRRALAAVALVAGLYLVACEVRLQVGWAGADRALASGDRAGALRCFARLAGLAPNRGELLASYGNALVDAGRPADALAAFDAARATFLDPNVEVNAGLCLEGLGDPARAEERYRRALAWVPASPAAVGRLGRLLVDRGDLDEARSRAADVAARWMTDPLGFRLGGEVAARQGRLDEAAYLLSVAVWRAPGHAPTLGMYAAVLEEAGRGAEATARLAQAAALAPLPLLVAGAPTRWRGHLARRWLADAPGDPEAVRALVAAAAAQAPGAAPALPRAVAALRARLASAPRDAQARLLLGDALEALGFAAEASREREAARALLPGGR